MSGLETITKVEDLAVARMLITALAAYGFHPSDVGGGPFPGIPGATTPSGIPIRVPADEATDARLLAQDLLRQMLKR